MKKSRLSTAAQRRLIDHFVAGTTAQCAASLVGEMYGKLPSDRSASSQEIVTSHRDENPQKD